MVGCAAGGRRWRRLKMSTTKLMRSAKSCRDHCNQPPLIGHAPSLHATPREKLDSSSRPRPPCHVFARIAFVLTDGRRRNSIACSRRLHVSKGCDAHDTARCACHGEPCPLRLRPPRSYPHRHRRLLTCCSCSAHARMLHFFWPWAKLPL